MTRTLEVRPEDEEFAAWLRARRPLLMSQEQLGRVLGLHQTKISKIECATEGATYSQAVRIAAALGLPLPVAKDVQVPPVCRTCVGRPPRGYTCNECGAS